MNKRILIWSLLLLCGTALVGAGGDGNKPDIKMIHAEGKIFYHEIFVTWSTEFELTSCDFLIEASENGSDWRIRGRVRSKGRADAQAEYKFVDIKDDRFKYYRIRKSDNRGQTETLREFQLDNYSIIVKLDEVEIDNEKKLIIDYSVDQDQELLVRIYNRIGEQVVTKVMPFKLAGEYIYQLDISKLRKDHYLLVVTQVLLDKSVAEKAFEVKK